MPFINNEDFFTRVSRGVSDITLKVIKAKSSQVNASATTMWGNTVTFSYLSTDTTLRISSTDAADATAGAGALVAYVEGLNSSYSTVSELILLSGQTPHTLTNQYFRINDFYITDCGSAGYNTGTIWLWDNAGTHTAGLPTTTTNVQGVIRSQQVDAMQGVYTLPVNTYGYIKNVWSGGGGGNQLKVEFMKRVSTTNGFITVKEFNTDQPFAVESQLMEKNYGHGDFQLRVSSASNGAYSVMAGMELLIVPYDVN